MNFLDQDILFLASSPKGIGRYALDVVAKEFLKVRGKKMKFFHEDESAEESEFVLQESCPHYLQAIIHL